MMMIPPVLAMVAAISMGTSARHEPSPFYGGGGGGGGSKLPPALAVNNGPCPVEAVRRGTRKTRKQRKAGK